MNLNAIGAELATRLDAIPGLRVFEYSASSFQPPAAFVSLPDRVTYDATYGRGSDTTTIGVLVLVSTADARTAHNRAREYADGSGPKSVKQALDSRNTAPYTACDMVRVTSCEFSYFVSGTTKYLAAEFTVDIDGKGTS